MTIPEMLAPYKTRWIATQCGVTVETARTWAQGTAVPGYRQLPTLAIALRMPLAEIAEAATLAKAQLEKSA